MTWINVRNARQYVCATLASLGALILSGPANAESIIQPILTQYIAAFGDAEATSGPGAERWGLWREDPGPRGVQLSSYETLKAEGGIAPAMWKFDGSDWWLEEHALIMEQPVFPVPPGRYVVTGGRDVTAILTVRPKVSAM